MKNEMFSLHESVDNFRLGFFQFDVKRFLLSFSGIHFESATSVCVPSLLASDVMDMLTFPRPLITNAGATQAEGEMGNSGALDSKP